MLLLDAILACICIKIFGDNVMLALGVMAAITIIRVLGKVSGAIDVMYGIIDYMFSEEEEI